MPVRTTLREALERARGLGACVAACWVMVSLLAGCQSGGEEEGPASSGTARAASGADLARTYCQGCHLLPEPDLLNKELWEHAVLPQMARFMGRYGGGPRPDSLFEGGTATRLVKQAGVYPEEPVLSRQEWEKIKRYYIARAPDAMPPQPAHPEIETGLRQFEVRTLEGGFRSNPPLTTAVQLGERGARLYVGDLKADYSTVNVLSAGSGRLLERVAPFRAPVRVRPAGGDTLHVLDMGKFLPTDQPTGRLMELYRKTGSDRYDALRVVVDSLQRPVDFSRADLNGDGRLDIVVSEFGRLTGRASWFEQQSDGGYRRHTLRNKPGAVRHEVLDLNSDGQLDVAVLMGQSDEGVYFFYNEGEGRFRQERVLRFPPSYGSTHFELLDFDGDGHLDILYVNGDNGDYYPLMRGYHGVRLFTGDGAGQFEEAFFFPLNGAYRATAEDFDQDGDLDIAAISFYPDYERSPEESFVYLENRSQSRGAPYEFAPRTFEGSARIGRWVTFASGDIDGDGDTDLVLGSLVGLPEQPGYISRRRQQAWLRDGPQLLVLENTAR